MHMSLHIINTGEVILPQLLRSKVPVPVAAATSTGTFHSETICTYCSHSSFVSLCFALNLSLPLSNTLSLSLTLFLSLSNTLSLSPPLISINTHTLYPSVVVALTCLACAEVQVSALVEAGGLAGKMKSGRLSSYHLCYLIISTSFSISICLYIVLFSHLNLIFISCTHTHTPITLTHTLLRTHTAIPWSLVVYMIPGVVTGAQIAAAIQGKFSKGTP